MAMREIQYFNEGNQLDTGVLYIVSSLYNYGKLIVKIKFYRLKRHIILITHIEVQDMCDIVQAQKWVSFLTTNFYEMTIGPTGYDEFMNSGRGYDPNLKPKIEKYEDYKDLIDKGVYIDESIQEQILEQERKLLEITYLDNISRTKYTQQSLQLAREIKDIQDRRLLEEEITQYLLNEYSEQEKVHYSWREFFEVFALVVYIVAMLTLMCHVSIIWQLILGLANFGVIFIGRIAYGKIKKHYKNQKEIDDLLCQYGVISMKDQPQHEEILYQQLVEKGVF